MLEGGEYFPWLGKNNTTFIIIEADDMANAFYGIYNYIYMQLLCGFKKSAILHL